MKHLAANKDAYLTMKSLKIATAFLGLVLLIGFNQLHAKVYKWVDENGKVHYSDKPFNKGEKQLEIKDNLTPEQQQAAKRKAKQFVNMQKRRVHDQLDTEYKSKKQKSEKEKAEKDLKKNCDYARSQLETLKMPTRIYRENEKGQQEYLTDETRQQEIKKLEKDIAQHCSGV
ncbi:DUF4124 domain-containing protein [Aliikangiella coralliicola]|uniref:DUF4124 domain-containing protein n=1 Tax=Aliikangiella coralliicola TaxID=2592383 RepID=A0A545TWC2_9GAMM|nr:DUF4124 domain-containing protein [Aliikangiella coralliicola]TQV81515.1 DUF4124 domain-containing protein [Aliikangiella coralliicola]